jgi:hypothetical protein
MKLPELLRTALALRNGGRVRNTSIEVYPLKDIAPVAESFWVWTVLDEEEAADCMLSGARRARISRMSADRRFQFSLAALFKVTLLVAVLLAAIPPARWAAVAWACLAVAVWTAGAASFYIAMVVVYGIFEAGFRIAEVCSKACRRERRSSSSSAG